ncbi:DEAD/DEAH box helicase [Pseudochelatococcus contaminans]|uniref:Superfamily II DNA or RNA helicase n=1 Tax=Pseudochelatococcus contaminans TaxID=1538103 RepID=A0A7W6EIB5_9HYPH|nr:DEAD/DEAH box helicase family protein [Pseudochelatococcus contaminans]MBB3810577.1 superfamily II DNA or RNA helicase [Pseudochelatococcus contaminans]
MSLFEDWKGRLTLPPLHGLRVKIGRNAVRQLVFRGATTRARIFLNDTPGHDLIKTELKPPYGQLHIRRKGAKRRMMDLPALTANLARDEALPETLTLQWDVVEPLTQRVDTPEKLLATWENQFSFRLEGQSDEPGLRLPQIGALHAIAAHFAVGDKYEPATVVLPTGTGKTETMLAAQVYLRPARTLVLVSGVPLRDQIEEKFATLGYLPAAQAIPGELSGPRVALISGGIRSVDEAEELLKNANIIIALPNSLEASDADAVAELTSGCSHLFVDEAHHITARTWRSVRDRFSGGKVIQFTATPFRRYDQRVDGKIIFNYKLGDAQRAGYYMKINLRTVEEYGDQEARDEVVARAAVEALRRDVNERKLDHILMARTETQARADALAEIYERLGPEFVPVTVYSDRPDSQNRAALAALRDRKSTGSRIVICVNMLGEGFDFAQLKLAALHDTHKSLAITLQFIGRFTRKGPEDVGEATVVTNIADPEAEKKLATLYAEGADWGLLIRRLSEERIDDELRLQNVIEQLKQNGTLAAELSLWNLRPAISTQFYRTKCKNWTPLEYAGVLPAGAETWYALDDKDKLLVAVVAQTEEVNWGDYQNVVNTLYDFVIVRWDEAEDVLSIYAGDYDRMRTERMAKAVAGDGVELFSGDAIFNILNGVELPLVKNLGSRRVGAISFTTYFGTNVTEGLGHIDKSEAELNNIACVGYDDGDRVLWGGAKRRGKVWQQRKSGSVADWVAWTKSTWDKVTSDDDVKNIIKGFLKPIKLTAPHASHAISAEWGEQAQQNQSERQSIFFGGTEKLLYEVDVGIDSIEAGGTINISFGAEDAQTIYQLKISESLPGGYAYERKSGPAVMFKRVTREAEPLEVYLQRDPVVIRYADGTHSYNCYHIPTNLEAGAYPKDQLEAWDFKGVPLNKELIGKAGDTATIQYRAFQHVRDEYDLVFNDDGMAEAGDLVCLKDVDENTIKLTLVHCKGAIGGRISALIDNFYFLCGQAQKCITKKHRGIERLVRDLKRREAQWTVTEHTRFLKGWQRELSYFKEKARKSRVEFEVILVQPGAHADTVTVPILQLPATTELFLKKTTDAKFRVVLNAARAE